jgi:hypothetical protein
MFYKDYNNFLIFSKTLSLLNKTKKMSTKILIIGACGQIGTELTQKITQFTEQKM